MAPKEIKSGATLGVPHEVHSECRYAWYRLFNLAKAFNKNLSQGDVHQLSCNVLLSALSIMPYQAPEVANTETDSELEKDRCLRMATILGFKVVCPPSLFIVGCTVGNCSWSASFCG